MKTLVFLEPSLWISLPELLSFTSLSSFDVCAAFYGIVIERSLEMCWNVVRRERSILSIIDVQFNVSPQGGINVKAFILAQYIGATLHRICMWGYALIKIHTFRTHIQIEKYLNFRYNQLIFFVMEGRDTNWSVTYKHNISNLLNVCFSAVMLLLFIFLCRVLNPQKTSEWLTSVNQSAQSILKDWIPGGWSWCTTQTLVSQSKSSVSCCFNVPQWGVYQ